MAENGSHDYLFHPREEAQSHVSLELSLQDPSTHGCTRSSHVEWTPPTVLHVMDPIPQPDLQHKTKPMNAFADPRGCLYG